MVMKTMHFLQRLSNLFIILICLVSVGVNAAETKWEVAIVFRGDDKKSDQQFQKDIDDNILELAKINPSLNLKIGIYRELSGKRYTYQSENATLKPIEVKLDLASFLQSAYQDPAAKKSLIIYSHGKGAEGLRGLSTQDLKETLSSIPHLDFLWFDACFMANTEFLYELRERSDYTISSEEAEFSSGLPFQVLSLLPMYASAKEAALALARNFIESYSYLKNGSQKNYVSKSSATISVIENKKLETIANSLQWVSEIIKGFSDAEKEKLKKALVAKASMDESSLVDLGLLLIEVRKINFNPIVDLKLTKIIRLLNIEAVRKLKTNPRIHLLPPAFNASLVYGFNEWTEGSKEDFFNNDIFQDILPNDNFIAGPQNKEWPAKKNISLFMPLTPFAPGINTFNYYFVDQNGKILTKPSSVSRTHDIVESTADSEQTPLLYTAYTQKIGKLAERYTGLNISIPGTTPTLDYFELEFNQLAQWLSL